MIAQVGAVEADVDHRCRRNAELTEDVVFDFGRRGGRQREYWWSANRAHCFAKAEIGRPKIVAPLRDAVRFINDEKRDVHVGEMRAKAWIG